MAEPSPLARAAVAMAVGILEARAERRARLRDVTRRLIVAGDRRLAVLGPDSTDEDFAAAASFLRAERIHLRDIPADATDEELDATVRELAAELVERPP
jgi:hypothetical protein